MLRSKTADINKDPPIAFFGMSHFRISSTDVKVRTTINDKGRFLNL